MASSRQHERPRQRQPARQRQPTHHTRQARQTRHRAPDGLWRNRNFLKLWGGETISLFGSQVTTVALPLTAISLLHATAFQVGALNAVGFAPFLLVTVVAGVWVDHRRRQPILVTTNLGRALLLGLIPLLALVGWLRIERLYVLWFLVGTLTVFFHLAYQAFLPELVSPRHLAEGNGKLIASESLAQIGGPGVAGILTQFVAAPLTLFVDALSFLVGATCVARIAAPAASPTATSRLRPATAPSTTPQRRILLVAGDIAEGFRFTLGDARLRAFARMATTYNFFWQIIEAVIVLYAVRTLGVPPIIVGALFAAGSAGGLVGALVTNRLARRWGVGRICIIGAFLNSLAPLAFPVVQNGHVGGVAVLLAAFFLWGAGATMCNVQAVSMRQALTPEHLLGRMGASYRLITYGVLPVGALLGGVLGQSLGVCTTLLIGALGLQFAWLWLVFSPVRRLRQIPERHAS